MKKAISTLLITIALAYSCTTERSGATPMTALVGATIFDGNGNRFDNSTLLVKDGKIEAIRDASVALPDHAEVVDLSGKYIIPGLVDAHVHFAQTGFVDGRPDALDIRDSIDYIALQARLQSNPQPYYEAYLRSGVTAVYDVGGPPWSISLQFSAEDNNMAPHVAAAGPLLTPVSQESLETFNGPTQKTMLELVSTDLGRQLVTSNTGTGSTGIKIWQINLEDPEFMSYLQKVAEETRRQGNYLIVHATTLAQAKKAIELGAKVLVHSVEDQVVDGDFLDMAREHQLTYTPTMVVLKGYYNTYKAVLEGGFEIRDPLGAVDSHTRALLEGAPGFAQFIDTSLLRQRLPRMENYIRKSDSITAINLLKVYKAGIRIAVGTDAGNPGTLHGVSIFDELEAMQNAGIPANDLLVMATRNGAVAMGRSHDLGTLDAGKEADLVILDDDPSIDITHLRSLSQVMREGVLRDVSKKFQGTD